MRLNCFCSESDWIKLDDSTSEPDLVFHDANYLDLLENRMRDLGFVDGPCDRLSPRTVVDGLLVTLH